MDIGVSNKVIVRDEFGQFIADVMGAATKSIQEAVDEGAALSRKLAPSRARKDARTIKLNKSIRSEITSRTSGQWIATARHALPIELGAAPHDLPGNVSFFWEEQGRPWYAYNSPEAFENLGWSGNEIIRHPGNAPQPYLRPAYVKIAAKLLNIMSKHYPG